MVKTRKAEARHSHLCRLAEIALAEIVSANFAAYRADRISDPDPKVEDAVGRSSKLSFGAYVQLLRSLREGSENLVVTPGEVGSKANLSAAPRFNGAVEALEEAVALDAGNIRRLVTTRLQQQQKQIGWYRFWELIVEYRNRSEGHPAAHNWPVDHPDYFEIMTPILEEAVLEALTIAGIRESLSRHPVAELLDIQYMDGGYSHSFAGEDTGLPFTTSIRLDRSLSDLWAREEWPGSVGSSYLLVRNSSGNYDVRGPFHSFLEQGSPGSVGTVGTREVEAVDRT